MASIKTASVLVFIPTITLLALGVVAVCSACMGHTDTRPPLMQPVWALLGLGVCALAAWKDYERLRTGAWFLLGLAVVLLVVILVSSYGITANRATRWLRLGPFSMQPSELAKLAIIIALAHYGAHFQRQMPSLWKGLVIPAAMMLPVVALVFVEPDVGAAMLIAAVGALILLVAGVRIRYLVIPGLLAGLALGCYLLEDPMRSERINSWLDLEATKLGKGLQTYRSMAAIGYGGVSGMGLGEGVRKQGYIPEDHTDFILAVIGEELGVVGTLLVLVGLMTIVLSGLYISAHARDRFGMLLAAGISVLIGFQALINIGVVTGALPNKGLSLPFISYGGSNLVILLAAIGLLLNVARHSKGGSRETTLALNTPQNWSC